MCHPASTTLCRPPPSLCPSTPAIYPSSIGQLCDHGFSALFTTKDVSLIVPTTTLKGTHNTDNRLYYMDLQSANQSPIPPIPPHYLFSNNVHAFPTKSDIVQFVVLAGVSRGITMSPVVVPISGIGWHCDGIFVLLGNDGSDFGDILECFD